MITPFRFVCLLRFLLSTTPSAVGLNRHRMLMQMWYFNANAIFIYTWRRKAAVVCMVKSLPDNPAQCILPCVGGKGLHGEVGEPVLG